MAKRLSRSAPYEIHSLDVHSLNDVFRQIQAAIDELKGLSGGIHLFDDVTVDGDITASGNVTVDGTLNVTDITFDVGGTITGLDASDVTYTPSDVTNWGNVDPGNVDDALDYLAANTSGGESDFAEGADTTLPWEDLVADSSMRILAAAEGNAAQLRALEPVTVGDSLIGELQLLDDGADALIYA